MSGMKSLLGDPPSDLLPLQTKGSEQTSIFDVVDAPLDWQSEWWGMPEFVMGDTEPIRKITVNFSSEADAEEFAKRLGLKITSRTDSVWFPDPSDYVAPKTLRWIDE